MRSLYWKIRWTTGFVLCLLYPMHAQPAYPASEVVDVVMLLYEEQEAGTDVYPVRILVSDTHVRIDDGHDKDNFVLLDRDSRRLSSVNHAERNILVIDYRAVEIQPPDDLELTEIETIDTTAPKIQGRQLLNRQLLANGETCLQLMVVPGLLDEAVSGLAEYARVLGARQLNNMGTVPDSMQTPCFLSRYAYAPARHLRNGLPVLEQDAAGYRRSLVNFRAAEQVPSELFSLPDGYEEFRL